MTDLILAERIESKIFQIRGKKVMLDKDLAFLYEVKPIALRQQVKRNYKRFPIDFMFQLTDEEVESLVSQNVIPSLGKDTAPNYKQKSPECYRGFLVGDRPNSFRYRFKPPVMLTFLTSLI